LKDVIKDIILTANIKNKPVEDGETDVFVHFDNGDKYVATFFSYDCLKNQLDADMKTDEFSLEHYYKILDMVLVKDFNNGNLRPVIECMIAEGDFQLVFRKL
jgi:hypothetical protein